MKSKSYLKEFYKDSLINIRKFLLLIFLVECLLIVIDVFFVTENLMLFLIIRVIIFNVFLGITYYLSFKENFAEIFELCLSILIIIAIININGIIFFGKPLENVRYEFGLLIIIMVVFSIRAISSSRAFNLVLFIFVVFNTLVIMMGGFTKYSAIDMNITMIIMMALGYLESKEKDKFLEKEYEEKIKLKRDLEYLNYHDILTTFYNRVFMNTTLIPKYKELNYPISIIISDINSLRLINSAFGHSAGDDLIINTAKIIKSSTEFIKLKNENDITLIRSDGDEFVTVIENSFENTIDDFIIAINENIEKEINQLKPSLSLGSIYLEKRPENIKDIFEELQKRLIRNKLISSKSQKSHVLEVLKGTLKEKTHETEKHIVRIAKLSFEVGKKLNLPNDILDDLVLASTLHDIGKIAIPIDILEKPGKLDNDEWEIIKEHPQIGYRIALSVDEFSHVSRYILYHHEKYDGSGYPEGLKGENIPLISRIISVTDSFDVMTNERPYKKAMDESKAVEELIRCSGTQFDPKIVEVLIEIL
ncbi:HD domain-containing phosphohydrolase [Clostridiaceae bacterium HSG29]|nr:HD domain-containing phosphohydrolase [Clostridiaceae bacterium HSG29]